MRNDDRFYYLYCHTNKINGKKYIGISVQKPSRRWRKDGEGYDGCPKFYKAIQKYGWDNFNHEILLKGLTQQEANEKEKEYIAKYNTIENGYNILVGGFDKSANGDVLFQTKPINQYSLDKNLIKTWDSSMDVERVLGFSHSCITANCRREIMTSYNYIWRYCEDCDDINNITLKKNYCYHSKHNTQQRQINQYDLDGILLRQWDSLDEASKSFNKPNTAILNCCDRRGKAKSAYGYQWRYSDDCNDISKLIYPFEKEIYEIDTQNNILHTFNKRKDVEDFYSTEKLRVYDVLYHKQKSTHGHIFIYADEYKGESNG